ncbi:hypothetical protein AB0H17_14155 [Streptomyces olivoreticuli]
MSETEHSVGEVPAKRVSLSLPERRPRVADEAEPELRGQILDEYLADCERRNGPVSERAQERARQIIDEVFAEGPRPASR